MNQLQYKTHIRGVRIGVPVEVERIPIGVITHTCIAYTVNMAYGFYVVYIAITSGKTYIIRVRAPDERPHRVRDIIHPGGIK